MTRGPAQFNIEAKEKYQSLDDEQMEDLKTEVSSSKVMSSKEIKADEGFFGNVTQGVFIRWNGIME